MFAELSTEGPYLITAIVALAGVVTFFYKKLEGQSNAMFKQVNEDLDECKKDREKLRSEIKNLRDDLVQGTRI